MIDRNQIYISVIICCYNSEKYISRTIKSVVDQTYKNWEIIFINDGSSDNTEKIILDFVKNNKNLSTKYFKQKNKGLANARNKGVELAKFDWIAILDHDDFFSTNRLEIQINNIINNPNCHLFFGNHFYLFEKTNSLIKRFSVIRKKDGFDPCKLNLNKKFAYNNLIRYGCFISSSTVVFKKSSCLAVGGFDENYKFLADYIFFLEMSIKYNFFCSDDILCTGSMHDQSATEVMKSAYLSEMNTLYLSLYKLKNLNFSIKNKLFIRQFKLNFKFYLNKIF